MDNAQTALDVLRKNPQLYPYLQNVGTDRRYLAGQAISPIPTTAAIQNYNDALNADAAASASNSMGASSSPVGALEGAIPVWGNGKRAYCNFQNGEWVQGAANTYLAATDILLVNALLSKGLSSLGFGVVENSGLVHLTSGDAGALINESGVLLTVAQ